MVRFSERIELANATIDFLFSPEGSERIYKVVVMNNSKFMASFRMAPVEDRWVIASAAPEWVLKLEQQLSQAIVDNAMPHHK